MPTDVSMHAADGTEPTAESQQILEENRALQAELQSLSEQVRDTEKSMHEIAALSQMFSMQVSMQSEKTLQLYNQVQHILIKQNTIGV